MDGRCFAFEGIFCRHSLAILQQSTILFYLALCSVFSYLVRKFTDDEQQDDLCYADLRSSLLRAK